MRCLWYCSICCRLRVITVWLIKNQTFVRRELMRDGALCALYQWWTVRLTVHTALSVVETHSCLLFWRSIMLFISNYVQFFQASCVCQNFSFVNEMAAFRYSHRRTRRRMSALKYKNHWTYHHQTWQVDSTWQVLVTHFIIWGQKVKCQGRREFALFWVSILSRFCHLSPTTSAAVSSTEMWACECEYHATHWNHDMIQTRSCIGAQNPLLRRSGYVFGRSDWCCSTEDMLTTCLCLVNVFRRRICLPFLNYWIWPQSKRKLPENQFFYGEKDALTENFQNFATKRFIRTLIHVLLPSFAETVIAEVTKWVRGRLRAWYVFTTKKRLFCRFLWSFWGDLTKNFIGLLFPRPSAKFCPNASSFRGDISENVF